MKFGKLLKKELRELITAQAIIGIVVIVVLFLFLGNVIGTVGKSLSKTSSNVAVCDLDNTVSSSGAIAYLNENNMVVKMLEYTDPVDLIAQAKEKADRTTVLVIPKGFEEGVKNSVPQQLEIISSMTSFATISDTDESASDAADLVVSYISSTIAQGSNIDPDFIKNPITMQGTTVVADKSAVADRDMLKGFGMAQSMFIPIIVFILITFATQLNCAAIANEKNDKTLETLLSTPVSRLDVIGSKMCASAIYSLLMAGVFIGCFASFMGTMAGTNSNMGEGADSALQVLGIKLSGIHFVGLGVQLFLTIAIALTISMILGALAKDLKATQGLITPLMFVTMIPYFVTMFTDINALPMVAKALLYAIPFTHTFAATGNLLFGDPMLYYFGLIYQAIWLVLVVWMAVRIFSSDKIFTMTLEFKKKVKTVSE